MLGPLNCFTGMSHTASRVGCHLRHHSLHDRFAFSVIWEMTRTGEIVKVEFCKSIIHSIAGLTYDEAQLMLDDPKIHDTKADSVRRLNTLAKIFRKRRIDAGALTLASPEVSRASSIVFNHNLMPPRFSV